MTTDTALQTTTEKVHHNLIRLRRHKLDNGYIFMCFQEHLPVDHAIYEYPDGRFEVVQIIGVDSPALFVRKATTAEIAHILKTNPAYGK